MNRTLLVAIGAFLTIAASLSGFVLIPNWGFRELQPVTDKLTGRSYPAPLVGDAALGKKVYVEMGCLYCHSQQVRMKGYGADIRRNWGSRRTVARDYIYEFPILLGTMRTGPDLANIGVRQPSANWHYLHLFDPQITSAGSVMPPHRFLFNAVRAGQAAPPQGVKVPEPHASRLGISHIVPKEKAEFLVTYLKSQDRSFPLEEAR